MADAGSARGPDERHYFGRRYEFEKVFQEELDVINERRIGFTVVEVRQTDVEVDRRTGAATAHVESHRGIVALGDPDRPLQGYITRELESEDVTGQKVWRPNEDANVVGLALSGGGIRSAAFCLGVLQALDSTDVLPKVDYLSTVSGGGYIGCSLTAALQSGAAQGCPGFPFTSALHEDEPPALQHIRDHSNYLFPHRNSGADLLHNAAIYARGLVVNAVLIAPLLFGASALTLLCYAFRDTIKKLFDPFGLRYFFISFELFILLVLLGAAWGIFQSWSGRQRKTEIPGWPVVGVGTVIAAFLIVAFAELQPLILNALMQANGNFVIAAKEWISTIAAILAPISAAFAYLSGKIGEYLKSAIQSPSSKDQTKGLVMKIAVVAAGLVVPVLLWMTYLDLTYWGLCTNAPRWGCTEPLWLDTVAYRYFDWLGYGHAATILYIVIAVGCLVPAFLMQPNANSLHPLYRDRLSKAFLFKPWPVPPPPPQGQPQSNAPVPWPVDPTKADLVEEWRPKLSDITGRDGPYHLINTALNVEASKVANRRGRNADFFIFSPKFIGSKSTGYVCTNEMEQIATGLDLATAMAASGAAVSSNMGAETIKPLTATLALLNVRLGYWLRNPARLEKYAKYPSRLNLLGRFGRYRNILANYYFIAEVLGQLSERRKSVYLTDGGHIENLGIYELLRRRCRVIIAVDSEADPQMAFGSFNTLERYALIDMGIRIDLPWQEIATMSLQTGKDIDDKNDAPKHHGPHCAIGEISYPGGRKGVLVYIKASLTGDENDYVFDYKKRYSAFPHETTIDQMFTEEQFEAYRALGFHAAFRLFDGDDDFAHLDETQNANVRGQLALLDALFQGPRSFEARAGAEKKT